MQLIVPILLTNERRKQHLLKCDALELNDFFNLTGKVNWLGHGAFPQTAFAASHLQQFIARLTVGHIETANKILLEIKSLVLKAIVQLHSSQKNRSMLHRFLWFRPRFLILWADRLHLGAVSAIEEYKNSSPDGLCQFKNKRKYPSLPPEPKSYLRCLQPIEGHWWCNYLNLYIDPSYHFLLFFQPTQMVPTRLSSLFTKDMTIVYCPLFHA